MTADFQPPPPPAAKVQLEALQSAFPAYSVSLIVPAPGEKPRYEAVSRTGGTPYCLVSTDAREIWDELRQAG
jgi:hypothetical protein